MCSWSVSYVHYMLSFICYMCLPLCVKCFIVSLFAFRGLNRIIVSFLMVRYVMLHYLHMDWLVIGLIDLCHLLHLILHVK
ncbi:hypothetical protein HanIR_Chr01g0030841 [Helianthus annuus]|nr:hypothetical protein HanIR_Chr01g0030841 [Helianthus annuus]